MSNVTDLLRTVAAFLNIQERAALAIFLAVLAGVLLALLGPAAAVSPYWIAAAVVMVFSGSIAFYGPIRKSWARHVERRRKSKVGVDALRHLNAEERLSLEFIYHNGGAVRSPASRVLSELMQLHVLVVDVNVLGARDWVYRIDPKVQKALRAQIGSARTARANGNPPWEPRGMRV